MVASRRGGLSNFRELTSVSKLKTTGDDPGARGLGGAGDRPRMKKS